MKTWAKRALAALLGSTLCVSAFTACTPTETELELVGEPTMTVTYDEETKEYTVVLEGFVKNVSGQNCEDAYIRVQYYDGVGDPAGVDSDWLDYLDAGETWHFYLVQYSESEPVRFEIEEATADLAAEEEASK